MFGFMAKQQKRRYDAYASESCRQNNEGSFSDSSFAVYRGIFIVPRYDKRKDVCYRESPHLPPLLCLSISKAKTAVAAAVPREFLKELPYGIKTFFVT